MKVSLGFVLFWGIVAASSVALARWKDWNAWLVFGAVALALVVNGLIATVEDDLPGGLNNPDGQNTPEYAKRFSRPSSRIIVGGFLLLLVAIVVGVLFRLDA